MIDQFLDARVRRRRIVGGRAALRLWRRIIEAQATTVGAAPRIRQGGNRFFRARVAEPGGRDALLARGAAASGAGTPPWTTGAWMYMAVESAS